MRLPDLHPILPKRRIGQSVDIISAHNIFSQIGTTCPTPRADRGKNSTPPAREEVLEMSKMLEVDSSFTKEASRNHGTRPSGQANNQPPMCVGFHCGTLRGVIPWQNHQTRDPTKLHRGEKRTWSDDKVTDREYPRIMHFFRNRTLDLLPHYCFDEQGCLYGRC